MSENFPAEEIFYLELNEIIILHARTMEIEPSRAKEHVRDRGLLDSALKRPQNAALYESATLLRQAATLAWGMIQNHPFHDGNKRTAWVVLRTFLEANGLRVTATIDERFAMIVGVAAGQVSVDELELWLQQHAESA